VTLLPLIGYTLRFPEIVLGRPEQVSVFSAAIHGGDPWGTLGAHVLRTLGMFFVRGDRIWRHNVPWRPVFDPLLGAAFIVGLVVGLRQFGRNVSAAFVVIWTAVMLLPTLLAEDAPHFLRAVGVLPVATLLPAMGLDWLLERARRLLSRRTLARTPSSRTRIARFLLPTLVAVPILFGLGCTAWAYFGEYAHHPYSLPAASMASWERDGMGSRCSTAILRAGASILTRSCGRTGPRCGFS